MRASKYADRYKSSVSDRQEIHISGAEGLFFHSELSEVVRQYLERALTHPKGKAEKVVITAEVLNQRPQVISSLPVSTVISRTPNEGRTIVQDILLSLGISKKAVRVCFATINRVVMRGAAIVSCAKGVRLDPDRQKGVRVSRLGIARSASRILSARLSRHGINTDRVKEALILASKVISCKDIVAEFCVSDDPHYTTGYVASEKFGYLRIPHIKMKGSSAGGRVFFVTEGADVPALINYLQTAPVLIGKVAPCKGRRSLDEILNNSYR